MHRDEIGLEGDWTYTHQLDKADLMLDIDNKAADGYAPFYVTVRPHSPGYSWTYGVIYAKSPSSTAFKFEVEPWLTATALQQKVVEYRGYGMHLVSVASHPPWP